MVSVPRSNGSRDEDFHLRYWRMKAALTMKKVADAFIDEEVDEECVDNALLFFISAFEGSALGAGQKCATAKSMGEKLQV